jgi:hypothetical protein
MEQFKQLVHEDDLKGKVIKDVIFTDSNCVMHFYNNEFCILKNTGYELNYIEIQDDIFRLEITRYNVWELKNYGFISENEYKEHSKTFQAQELAEKEQRERELFETLKAKYL